MLRIWCLVSIEAKWRFLTSVLLLATVHYDIYLVDITVRVWELKTLCQLLCVLVVRSHRQEGGRMYWTQIEQCNNENSWKLNSMANLNQATVSRLYLIVSRQFICIDMPVLCELDSLRKTTNQSLCNWSWFFSQIQLTLNSRSSSYSSTCCHTKTLVCFRWALEAKYICLLHSNPFMHPPTMFTSSFWNTYPSFYFEPPLCPRIFHTLLLYTVHRYIFYIRTRHFSCSKIHSAEGPWVCHGHGLGYAAWIALMAAKMSASKGGAAAEARSSFNCDWLVTPVTALATRGWSKANLPSSSKQGLTPRCCPRARQKSEYCTFETQSCGHLSKWKIM